MTEPRVERQTENSLTQAQRCWKGFSRIAKITSRLLKMYWSRIVNKRLNSISSQVHLELIAFVGLHDVGLVNMELTAGFGWNCDEIG